MLIFTGNNKNRLNEQCMTHYSVKNRKICILHCIFIWHVKKFDVSIFSYVLLNL